MHKRELDISGRRYGKLTALEYTRKGYWLFSCDCGNKKVMFKASVVRDGADHCGCSPKRHNNITGQTFGHLTAIRRVENKGRATRWLFKCVCGKEKIVFYDTVKAKNNPVTCCGCQKKIVRYSIAGSNSKDITGLRFGYLIAQKQAYKSLKGSRWYWECLCDCGKTATVRLSNLKSGNIVSCGCMRYKHGKCVGEKSSKWKGGFAHRRRDTLLKEAAGKFTNLQWKAKLEYFGNRCYLCRIVLTDKITHREHRIPLSRGGTNWIANIAPACKKCNLSKNAKTEKEFREMKNL